ncbi:MAG: aspartate carbamoyltransferase [Planctomycetota bacterium]|jgi:aspartate carbamoyltransferase catalytic subunit|nr:aspartate carbamoyltransferase [Planctomycetota bacterium]MDP6937643.1 aspartate carbamoyltransferase [Planctomycetota bacterium]HJM56116.1 aspartate carbamoyltransferase [Planctomycetota bacterium]
MTQTLRHLVSIDDLSVEEIRALFAAADRFAADPRGHADLCPGMISASLFYEPSTRTRLSFESAMLRLGGGVITAAEMKQSSASKGESLADTVRVVGGAYSDVIVLRHPSEGAARLAAQYSPVPVINAGDGAHEHPTQTLCDLYNLHVERGRIEGLDVVLAGDLKYSRTVHSFAYALARFGANIVCVPQAGFEMPEYVLCRLREEFGVEPIRADARRLGNLASDSDAVYLTPQKPHQLSLFTDARGWEVEHVDALYMTRPQTERHGGAELSEASYLRLEKRSMAVESLRDAVVMHPLPRRDEIDSEIDSDPRSIYFKQAARGVPIRMAILGLLLGRSDLGVEPPAPRPEGVAVRVGDNPCPNPACISRTETRHVTPAFTLAGRVPLRAHCAYCSRELTFEWVGCSSTGHYHAPGAGDLRRVRPDHLVFFTDRGAAEACGFKPAARSRDGISAGSGPA